MAHSIILRRVIVGIAAIALFFISTFQVNAQTTYKRSALVEEVTGQWCGWCPLGAWYMDSLHKYMPNNAIIISWHNQDDLESQDSKTFHTNFGVSSWPTYYMNRYYTGGFGYVTNTKTGFNEVDFSKFNGLYSQIDAFNKQPSPVDFRLVNVTYQAASRTLDFDLDATPVTASAIPTEDTAQYAFLAVLTEDGIQEYQHDYGLDGNDNPSDIDPFTHNDVGRQAISNVAGDNITLGLKIPTTTLPVRKHYTIAIDGAWNADMVKIKSAVFAIAPKVKTPKRDYVFDAHQSLYATALPSVAPDAAWVVLPNSNSIALPNVPTNIVWATGGSIGNSVKLEYSIDNGTTWNLIIASTGQSPYPWTVPQSAYGGTAMVRASAGSVNGVSEAFKTPGLITISKPAAGEIITGGTADYLINFKGGNVKSLLKFEYTTDNGSTWNLLGNLGNTDATSFDWSVVPNPTADAPQSMIRITDANGVVGTSGVFTIKSVANLGTIGTVSVTGLDHSTVPNIASNRATTITWTTNGGNVGTKLIAEYTVDNTITWQTISNSIDPTLTSVNWTTPAGNYANGCFVRVRSADLDKSNITAQSSEFSIGNAAGISGLKIKDVDANNHIGSNVNTTISWTSVGDVGTALNVQYSSDGNNWSTIPNGNVGPAVTSIAWVTPASYVATGYIRVISADKSNLTAETGPFVIGAANGVASTSMNGYTVSNYPNPFASETTINFTLPVRSTVSIRILDDLGREIDHLVSETLDAGNHSVIYNASRIANGVYTYTLESGATKLVGKLTVVK